MDAVEKTSARGPAILGLPRRALLLSLLLALLAPPGHAQLRKARTPDGDLLLVRTAEGWAVEAATGERTVLPLPADARVNDFHAGGDGWLTAAVVDGEGGQVVIISSGGRPPEQRFAVRNRAAPARENLLREPLLLLRGSGGPDPEVAAVLWLGGDADDRLAVRVAGHRNGEWQRPQTISPPGRGTQIALSAAVLADGSWLVAWAAFDGHDDEILWSRSADGNTWSKPERLAADNRVPDITPHLHPAAGGALAAWSRYDGNDYRVLVARFDGEGWSAPATVGVPGSVAPVFDDGERPVLVYRRAMPRGWGVVELDAEGVAPEARSGIVAPEARPGITVLRQTDVAAPGARRPVVSEVTAEGVRLRWPDGQQTSLAWQPAPATPR